MDAGRVHAVIGPNGAGKAILFNLITSLYWPSTADIRLGGALRFACAPWHWP